MEGEPARDVGQPHREQGRRQVGGDAIGEGLHRRRRAPDVDVDVLAEQRPEEPQPLQVVEVQVGEEEVDRRDLLVGHDHAEGSDPGAGVEHHHGAIRAAHLHARGVPAVAEVLGARRRERPPTSPDPRLQLARLPEDAQDAVHLAGVAEQRVGGVLDPAAGPVERRHQQHAVGGLPLHERDPRRRVASAHGLAIDIGDIEHGAELVGGDRTHLGERLAEHELGRLVVEDEHPLAVDQEHRCRQVGGRARGRGSTAGSGAPSPRRRWTRAAG